MPAVWAVAALATASAHAWRERMSIATTILRSSEPVHSATISTIIRINEWISSAVPPPWRAVEPCSSTSSGWAIA